MSKILWILGIIATASFINTPLKDPDLWWHIVIGRWIVYHIQLPVIDFWTLFGQGRPWIAYSWSNEIVYALIDSYFKLKGLYWFQWILSVAFIGSSSWIFGKVSKNYLIGFLLGSLLALSCAGHFSLRPQSITWILFLFTIYNLFIIREKNSVINNVFALFIIVIVWTNTHVTFIFPIIATALICFSKESLRWLPITLLTIVATFITPYLGREWSALFQLLLDPFEHKFIAEFSQTDWRSAAGGYFLILSTLLFIAIKGKTKFFDLSIYIFLSFIMLIGLMVIKFLPYTLIFETFLLAYLWGRFTPADFGNIGEGINRLCNLLWKLRGQGLAFLFFAIIYINLGRGIEQIVDNTKFKTKTMDLIRSECSDGTIFASFGLSGYVLYNMSDKEGNISFPLALDSRTQVTPSYIYKFYSMALYNNNKGLELIDWIKPKCIVLEKGSPILDLLDKNLSVKIFTF